MRKTGAISMTELADKMAGVEGVKWKDRTPEQRRMAWKAQKDLSVPGGGYADFGLWKEDGSGLMRYWRKGDFIKIVYVRSQTTGRAIPQGAPTGETAFDLLKPYPDGAGYYPERKFRSLEELTVFCAARGEFDLVELPPARCEQEN